MENNTGLANKANEEVEEIEDLTVEYLLQNKGIIEQRIDVKPKRVAIPGINGKKKAVYIQAIDPNKIAQFRSEVDNDGGKSYECNKKIVYYGMKAPNLKDPELQMAYGTKTSPYETATKLFKPFEIGQLADMILSISNVATNNPADLITEIKNA